MDDDVEQMSLDLRKRNGRPKGSVGTHTMSPEERVDYMEKKGLVRRGRGLGKRLHGNAKNVPLTRKQELYCQYRVNKGLNKSNAYRTAYGDHVKDPYMYAYLLEKKPHIQYRIQALREERASLGKFYGGPEESLMRWNEMYQDAIARGDLKIATKAQENIDKIIGADKANLMNDDIAKTMFLAQNKANDEEEYKEQIAAMLVQLGRKDHQIMDGRAKTWFPSKEQLKEEMKSGAYADREKTPQELAIEATIDDVELMAPLDNQGDITAEDITRMLSEVHLDSAPTEEPTEDQT